MGQTQHISKNNTVVMDQNDKITVILHQTPVVEIDKLKGLVTYNNGGWITATTVARMNQASNEFNLPWRVGRKQGVMSARNYITDETIEFNGDILVLPIRSTSW